MPVRRQIAVLGLGLFGQTVAIELTRLGHDVLAIDENAHIVQLVSDKVTHAVQADMTDAAALEELGLPKFDAAIVAVSESLEASILTTVLLKRFGIANIVAKAANELHGSILRELGVTRVVHPEREMGLRVAHSFAARDILDYFDVAPGYGFARLLIPHGLAGKPLSHLDLNRRWRVTPVALHRSGSVTLNPEPTEVLRADDELILAGLDEDLARLPAGLDANPRDTR
jgi:trk system potassium uptake protein TrkA